MTEAPQPDLITLRTQAAKRYQIAIVAAGAATERLCELEAQIAEAKIEWTRARAELMNSTRAVESLCGGRGLDADGQRQRQRHGAGARDPKKAGNSSEKGMRGDWRTTSGL